MNRIAPQCNSEVPGMIVTRASLFLTTHQSSRDGNISVSGNNRFWDDNGVLIMTLILIARVRVLCDT